MVDSPKNYFIVLGLQPDASPEEIKRAFKEIAFQNHPDRNPHNPQAEEKFKEALEAYSFLTGNLEAYRALQSSRGKRRVSGEEVQDILKILFDIDIRPASHRPRLLQAELTLRAEEAFSGGDFKLTIHREDLCPHCQGRGVEPGAKVFTCTYCFGMGEIGTLLEAERRECPKCNGRGLLSSKACLKCRARGAIPQEVKLKVTIPSRVCEGEIVEIPGEGHEISLGQRSDLRIILHVEKHPWFSFDGKDIICETTVEMGDAALGGEIQVPTLNGSIPLAIPAGTQSGQVFRLKGYGLGGDQFVKILVKTPVAVSEKERQLIKSLKAVQTEKTFWQRLKRWLW